MKVYDILSHSARAWPERPAIVDSRGALGYEALHRRVEATRERLEALGVGPGLGVGVMGGDSRSFVISVFAALGSGATVMPIPHDLGPEELREALEAAPLHAILDDAGGIRPVEGSSIEIGIPDARPMRFAWTGVRRDLPFVPRIPDAAFVRFTSGTTGRPKAVVLSNRSVLERTAAANNRLEISERDVVLWVLPMAFHFFVSIVLYLRYGATILLGNEPSSGPDRSPGAACPLLEMANRHGATVLYASPAYYKSLTALPKTASAACRLPPGLRFAISTSTGLARETALGFHERFGVAVSQAYGIIEVGLPLVNLERPLERPESVGRPLPGYDVTILNEEGNPVDTGEVGELAVRGPGLFAGYLDPPLSQEDVLRDGWFLTGDLAQSDAEDFVTILGRRKSALRLGDRYVFPEEIEAVLDAHPSVARSRVSALEAELFAEVVPRPGAPEVGAEAILAFCRERLEARKVPADLRFVESITLTRSGKVSRR